MSPEWKREPATVTVAKRWQSCPKPRPNIVGLYE